MSWRRLAEFVLRRPGVTLLASLVVLAPPAAALPALRTSFDVLHGLPENADSVAGFEALEGSFEPGQVQPVVVMVEARKDLWNDGAFAAIDQVTINLEKVGTVSQVRSITRPTAGDIDREEIQKQLEASGLGDIDELSRRLPRALDGLDRVIEGLGRIGAGLVRIGEGVPQQRRGLARAEEGIEAMRRGLDRILPGLGRIEAGLGRIGSGLGRAAAGLRRLADEVAEPTLRSLQAAWRDLRDATVARLDPQFPDLARHVGEALAAVSGRCPDATGIGPQPKDCPAGERVDPRYDGLGPTLREAAEGLDRARVGVARIGDGVVQLRVGLGRIDQGLGRLHRGLAGAGPRLGRLEDGLGRMVEGVDRIVPGLERLRRGLALGSSLLQRTGLIPRPSELALTASLVEAFPGLRRRLELFMGDGGRSTRLFVILDRPPYRPTALEASKEIQEVANLSLRETPLDEANVYVAGSSPFFSDVADASNADFPTIVWAVVIGVFIVLALLLRSLVAPTYLVLTVLLSFASTMGLTIILFQGVLGEPGLVWWLPPFLFVILVALGADYNIFLTGRIREEAGRLPTRQAVARGLAATGHVITSAGLILAGTFAALMASPLQGMVEFGFAATVGLLIDTFVVRSLLVPSIAVMVGSASWWPSGRARRP